MKASFAIAVSAALILASCTEGPVQTSAPNAAVVSETAAEKALRESNDRLQKTVVEGMVIGTTAGALFGALNDGRRGALRGAGIGLIGGSAAGIYVRNLQAKYASEERVLNQVLRDIARTNAELERSISAMRTLLAENKAAIAKGTSGAKARGRTGLAEMREAISHANQQSQFFGEARGLLISQGTNGAAMDPQLARLSQRIATMKELSAGLAAAL